ncbi:MAG: hypothetical protein ACJA1H_000233 [Glaciecola sp.]|jgi:hypothetical protein
MYIKRLEGVCLISKSKYNPVKTIVTRDVC